MSTNDDVSIPSVILGTAQVRLGVGKSIVTDPVRGLCDSGSQVNLVTENCIQRYGIKKIKQHTPIAGIGSTSYATGYINVRLLHSKNNSIWISARLLVVARISSPLPEHRVEQLIKHETVVTDLADINYNIPGPIDILIGAGTWAAIVSDQVIRETDGRNTLIAQQTRFGWVISGQTTSLGPTSSKGFNITLPTELLDLNSMMTRFWEIESIPKTELWTMEEKRAERIFVENHTRDINGRFVVHIPLKEDPPPIGSSRDIAVACFHGLERRFKRQPELYTKYRAVIDDYRSKGHLVKVNKLASENGSSYFIPHHPIHAVPKKDGRSGKFRVVFNASAKTSTGSSFNDQQLTGPKLQAELIDNLIRFRTHRYGLSADIVQMFRQIGVTESQWDLQRIIWRNQPSQALQEFAITVVTWGMASAGFNSVRALRQCAIDSQDRFPIGANVALNDFYYDDMHTGADNQDDLFIRYDEVSRLLSTGGFTLSKWATNSKPLADAVKTKAQTETMLPSESGVLGMCWRPEIDELSLKLSPNVETITPDKLTKRIIISRISQVFDPCGLIAPVVIFGKIIIQELWKAHVDWDELVPQELASRWNSYWENIISLNKIRIPRWIQTTPKGTTELHIFSDASEAAYGAAAYIRAIDQHGVISCHLLTAKSKVAPIKKVTIPRLELMAAVMGAELAEYIHRISKLAIVATYFWTDSSIVYYWIHKDPGSLKPFVTHRVTTILQLSSPSSWRHVSGDQNPADMLSRGVATAQLTDSPLWWHGPSWLLSPSQKWAKSPIPVLTLEEQESTSNESNSKQMVGLARTPKATGIGIIENGKFQTILDRNSTLGSSLRVTAFVLRFIQKIRDRAANPNRYQAQLSAPLDMLKIPAITAKELDDALFYWVNISQRQYFSRERKLLKKVLPLPKNSRIHKLKAYIDDRDLICVGGRIDNAELPDEKIHPLILPPKCRLTMLLIRNTHFRTYHGGPSIMTAFLRQRFWIPSIRQRITSSNHRCVTCIRYHQKPQEQLMGSLPAARVVPAEPFLKTGVDFAGPYEIKRWPGRQPSARINGVDTTMKAWIVIYVCMVSKAVHIDLVVGLTIEEFMESFSRFVARKGRCIELWSDNGTTFVGTANELERVLQKWAETLPAHQLSKFGTTWKFIPPGAPHQGGLWESGVKSIKMHLKKIIGSRILSQNEFYTILTQIEGLLNSRPLWPISDNVNDLLPLTPAHLVLGKPIVQQPLVEDIADEPDNRLTLWGQKQKLVQHFWKRWREEYLVNLQKRTKWYKPQKNLKPGDMVIIREENTPPADWCMGRVLQVFPGNDGLVRSARIKTSTTELDRPIQKLCVLPSHESYPATQEPDDDAIVAPPRRSRRSRRSRR